MSLPPPLGLQPLEASAPSGSSPKPRAQSQVPLWKTRALGSAFPGREGASLGALKHAGAKSGAVGFFSVGALALEHHGASQPAGPDIPSLEDSWARCLQLWGKEAGECCHLSWLINGA